MNKDIIRRHIKGLRDRLSDSEVMEKSQIITDKFYNKYSYLDVFLLYYPHGREVNTINLINKLYMLGKCIFLPVVISNTMVFKKFIGFEDLQIGRFGIYEPSGELLTIKPDIMCIPGIAFDNECNRIGYGGGFYDKYIATNNNFIKSAIAYDFQVVDNIETECFDVPVDEIFTDKCIISRRI